MTVALDCLKAVALGPFLPDWEFSTLMGCSREEAVRLVGQWEVPPTEQQKDAAINAMNNILGYPIDHAELVGDWIAWSGDQVKSALDTLSEWPERRKGER